jgi:hypothetical protein
MLASAQQPLQQSKSFQTHGGIEGPGIVGFELSGNDLL